ncbi:MAG: peptide chain release factor N(5)-glutamine methyltransferase [Candidatus Omnitrophota bacterium]
MNETELLFTGLLDCDRTFLYLNKGLVLDKDKLHLVSSALKKRVKGEPIQYILGKTEFMGLEFKVTPDVLIPRPETEILVETVIKYANRLPAIACPILELGTGSGCIAVSLAKYLPESQITATDVSKKALLVARYNAKLNKVAKKIKFLKSDLFKDFPICDTCLPAGKVRYAICVSNPPYIASSEIKRLQPEVQFEPEVALNGGSDGLYFYENIIKSSPKYLRGRGFLIFEIGFNQKDAVKKYIQNSGYFEIIEIIKDYNNLDRVVVARMLN